MGRVEGQSAYLHGPQPVFPTTGERDERFGHPFPAVGKGGSFYPALINRWWVRPISGPPLEGGMLGRGR